MILCDLLKDLQQQIGVLTEERDIVRDSFDVDKFSKIPQEKRNWLNSLVLQRRIEEEKPWLFSGYSGFILPLVIGIVISHYKIPI